jgi:hypothetical protein
MEQMGSDISLIAERRPVWVKLRKPALVLFCTGVDKVSPQGIHGGDGVFFFSFYFSDSPSEI